MFGPIAYKELLTPIISVVELVQLSIKSTILIDGREYHNLYDF
jgi:hypothetical protein